ncbi:hypothetical protein GCM10007977_101690 [Dactylosporangium sucinum]|uniref:Uncharacterized protein n=1 Tax=Dactylosporangium sucinum TaxID=1424081 RepID=A0A917UDZ3_9ACTN|nr:hypothetical protein GCM10007977_101690 [Dactylosporangium sucinum]
MGGPVGVSITTGPGPGSATIGARDGGVLSSVALPATTTIIVGTEVSATSSAEISKGRRFGENVRCVRTSAPSDGEDNGDSKKSGERRSGEGQKV